MMYLVAAKSLGHWKFIFKELLRSEVNKESCHTLPMQENNIELLQEMEDVKATNYNTAVQNYQSNLVLCKKVL
jgi:hypothetical protein